MTKAKSQPQTIEIPPAPVIIPQGTTQVALPPDLANRLAQYAQETKVNEQVTGQFFSTRSGVLSFNKVPLPNNTMDVVILRSMHENVYYPEKFQAEKIEAPMCFAFSHSGEGMVPHSVVVDKQGETCAACPMSKWTLDVADQKNRKPCKELRRLACMPSSALHSAEAVEKADVGFLRIPVTSTKFWSAYATKLASGNIPPFAAVTRVRLVPDPKNQIRFEFECLKTITDPDIIEALFIRHEGMADAIGFPYAPRAPAAASTPAQAAPAAAGKF